MSSQLSFEGMDIEEIESSLKASKVSGLEEAKIGDKVRFEGEAIVVSVGHRYDEKLAGGLRAQVLEPLRIKVTEIL